MSTRSLIECEKGLFKCILSNPKLLYEVDREWFCDIESKILYDSIRSLDDKGQDLTVENIFITSDNDNIKFILENEIIPCNAKLEEFPLFVQRLKEEYVKQDIDETLKDELFVLVNEKGKLNISKAEELQQKLRNDLDLLNSKGGIRDFSEIGNNYRKELIARKEGNFYSYGDNELDKITVGANPGQITTILGVSGMGKSAYAVNLFNKEINKRIPAVYVTLEMDEVSTMDRLIALRTKIPVSDLMMRNFENSEVDDKDSRAEDIIRRYDEEYKKLSKLQNRFCILDKPGIKLPELESTIQRIKEKMGVDYLIVIVDLWTMIGDVGTEAKFIEKAINITSDIAKRQNVHFINIVQANKVVDDKTISVPEQIDNLKIRNINKIKNSASIGERSRVCISVFRPKHYIDLYFPELSDVTDDTFEVSVLKCSQGIVGKSVKYLYEPEIFRISPLIEDEE